MLAAVYARKSTDQAVADEAKSVTRQVDHARQYAASKGWTVLDAHVYIDDGVSGAEFANRPGFVRLMNALKQRPPFQVLVMSEDSRLGREAIETAYALKQIIAAGVRVFTYLEDRERTLDSPTEKILMSLTAYASEMEREQARQRMLDTMTRKAKAGHVTGGRCYGYDQVRVDGHVEQRINPHQAAAVLRIFELAAAGLSHMAIAKQLNADGVAAPRAQQGRPSGWGPSSVHEALSRDRYRGQLVWNKTKKRNRWGARGVTPRPEAEWIRVPAPQLRIVSEALWAQAHQQIAINRTTTNVYRGARRSIYLLPGFARCAWCGGGLYGRSRQGPEGQRRKFYACTAHFTRGAAICRNNVMVPMADMDCAVLTALGELLTQDRIEQVVEALRTEQQAPASEAARLAVEARVRGLERQADHLAQAVSLGGDVPALVAKLKAVDADRRAAVVELEALTAATRGRKRDWVTSEQRIRRVAQDWRRVLQRNVPEARAALGLVLAAPIQCTPLLGQERGYRFEGRATFGALLRGEVATVRSVESPGRIELPA